MAAQKPCLWLNPEYMPSQEALAKLSVTYADIE